MAPRRDKVSSSTPLLDDLGPVKVKPYCPVTVEPILLFVGIGIMMANPLQQQYIYYSLGNGTTSAHNSSGGACGGDYNSSDSGGQAIQAEASHWLTYISLCSSLPSLLIAAILGPMSDKVGRKVAIVTPVAGALAMSVCSALVVYLNLPLQVLLPGALLYGMLGSSTTLYGGCFAYLTDVTEPGNPRAFRMAILESCLGIAAVVGVLSGNLWLSILGAPLGFQEPFWFAAGLVAFSLLYGIFGIKETRPKRRGQKAFSLASVSGMVHLVRHSFKTGQWKLAVILFVFFLNSGIYITSSGIITLTVIAPPYCWSSDLLGYFYTAACAGFVVGVVGIKLLGKCLSSYGMMHVGFLSGAAGMVIEALAVYTPNRDVSFYLATAAACVQTMPAPLMKATMSKMVPQSQQGSLFALIACIESLAGVIFVPVWNTVFGVTVFILPGLVFLCFAGALLVQSALIGVVQCHTGPNTYDVLEDENDHIN
ncbi:proton-coupled folate transporter-like [Branchiostoma lanceolatum]|uniref:proton-coupled folate transporter-like n=1 Tax=Branchiostoma lanceolatum TaxID=7740 RepID=UPI0034572B15